MLRAGTAAASCILRDHGERLAHGVALYAGPGNNGGDAYVIAAQLARAGVTVRLHAAAAPRTDEATRAAALAAPALRFGAPTGGEGLVVDGLLGTGHTGPLRDGIRSACTMLRHAHDRAATVVALDVPTGLDATTGEIADGSVPADTTLSFGTLKRGQLVQRAHVGRLVLLDIGLARSVDLDDGAWTLHDPATLHALVPSVAWNAHKGARGRLLVVGGADGMAGAVTLAVRGALHAGAGLVRAAVSDVSVPAVQAGVPQALAAQWESASQLTTDGAPWAHAVAIGPGLGLTAESRRILERTLAANPAVPVLLDADALTLAASWHTPTRDGRGRAGEPSAIAALLAEWSAGRPGMVLTPHPGEFARLRPFASARAEARADDWQARADALSSFAIACGATVLLKGAPTLVATPDGAPLSVVPRGTSMLATGGSGDLLTGIIGALLAGGVRAADAATLGASVHGLAAEHAGAMPGAVYRALDTTRGRTLDAVLDALPHAWRDLHASQAPNAPDVLLSLPALA